MKTQNILIRLSYDGTGYSGFQFQLNAPSVQEKLEKAIKKIYKVETRVTGAGRTDSGVHATGQAVSFPVPPVVPVENIPLALNSALPRDIVVWSACLVPAEFNARFHARAKTYTYTIDISPYIQVLHRLYAWHCREPLVLKVMEEAAHLFEGQHDFRSFRAAGSSIKNTVRNIKSSRLQYLQDKELLVFQVTGNGFLYKMVRKMAGALVNAGRGRIEPAHIKEALVLPADNKLFPALPAKGLCLKEVFYPPHFTGGEVR